MSIKLEYLAVYYETPKETKIASLKINDNVHNFLSEIAKKQDLNVEIPTNETIKYNIDTKSYLKKEISNDFKVYIQKSSISFNIQNYSGFEISGRVTK